MCSSASSGCQCGRRKPVTDQLERAEKIIREWNVMMEALVAVMMDRELVLGREVMELLRDSPGSASAA